MKRERRRVRILALQALYEIDCVGHPAEEVIARYLEENTTLSKDALDFFRTLVLCTLESKEELDQFIAQCAPDWPVEELAIIDRSILRIALWELAASGDTPMKVAINEAVELAKRFGSDNAPRFVNGVLGTVAANEALIHQLAGQKK
jgi:N utilization substance protein B